MMQFTNTCQDIKADLFPLVPRGIKSTNLTIWIKSKLSEVRYLKALRDQEWQKIEKTGIGNFTHEIPTRKFSRHPKLNMWVLASPIFDSIRPLKNKFYTDETLMYYRLQNSM